MQNLSYNCSNLTFKPPPECPVLEPTEEEFSDPYAYFAKIKSYGEKAGIVKVKPPSKWQPPFAVDVEHFRFTPRIQRLSDLDAKSRVKLLFLEKLSKFWKVQGVQLKIPWANGRYLDFFDLHKIVQDHGGFEKVTQDRLWARIGARMSFPAEKGFAFVLKSHYEKWLYAYDVFKSGASLAPEELKECKEKAAKLGSEEAADQPSGVTGGGTVGSRMRMMAGGSRKTRMASAKPIVDTIEIDTSSSSASRELKQLQFRGAGPKMQISPSSAATQAADDGEARTVAASRKSKTEDPAERYHCHTCQRGDSEEALLLCERCDDAYHTFCLIPPLSDIPRGDWCCPKCVAVECCRPAEPYGFETSKTEYSLETFGEKADAFKADYFKMPVHMVPNASVEQEFWRLVGRSDMDVSVEYGADVHAGEMGSGFPTPATRDRFPNDDVMEYIEHPWNLNNLPVLEKSVLRHINADITGMKVPWCYVGMVFSAFCWHVEDHWSYSINYLHWGEPKTWYGIAPHAATKFEACMKRHAPELFEECPDLLHQLTTTMNPELLMKNGIPVVRTNQCAGEFIVTFPRGYHAGFNNGYNFAEAVNFCPYEWLPIGRLCVDNYRLIRRQNVFSHDELVCKMASEPDKLDLVTAAATHQEMVVLIETEKKMRRALLDMGVSKAEREAFELLPDDERQCSYCRTTCFLSALSCSCRPESVVCLHHATLLPCAARCPPTDYVLRYRYTLDELPRHLFRLRARAETFDVWATKVRRALRTNQRRSTPAKSEPSSAHHTTQQTTTTTSSTTAATTVASALTTPTPVASTTAPTSLPQPPPPVSAPLVITDVKDEVKLEPVKLEVEPTKTAAPSPPKQSSPASSDEHLPKPTLAELRALVSEAESNDFPPTDLLAALRLAVREADKCSSVAAQLLRNKDRTRCAGGGGGGGLAGGGVEHVCLAFTRSKAQTDRRQHARLTFEELRCFVQQVEKLPCTVPEAPELRKLLEQIASFRLQAETLLASVKEPRSAGRPAPLPASEQLEKLLDIGDRLAVELPEVTSLRTRMEQVRWLESIDLKLSAKADESALTLQNLRSLIEQGERTSSHPAVDRALSQLRFVLKCTEQMDNEARVLMHQRPKPSLRAYTELLKHAESLPTHLATVKQLADIVAKAEDWLHKHKTLMEDECYPHVEKIELMLSRGHALPVHLEPLRQVEKAVNDAHQWLDRASSAFKRKTSPYTLLELLGTRCADIQKLLSGGGESKKRPGAAPRGKAIVQQAAAPLVCGMGTKEFSNLTLEQQMKANEEERKTEASLMRDLRLRNMEKLNPRWHAANASAGATLDELGLPVHEHAQPPHFCHCQRMAYGPMLDCDLCREWYHGASDWCVRWTDVSCITVPSTVSTKFAAPLPPNAYLVPPTAVEKDAPYVCTTCQRSRRPHMQTMLLLLVNLKQIPATISEGELLVIMVDYAIWWQDRVHALFKGDSHVKTALEQLEAIARKVVDANRPLAEPSDESADVSDTPRAVPPVSTTLSTTDMPVPAPGAPLVVIPDLTRAKLDDLYMIGALLELQLEECDQLWKLLRASEPHAAARRQLPFSMSELSSLISATTRAAEQPGSGGAKKRATSVLGADGEPKRKRVYNRIKDKDGGLKDASRSAAAPAATPATPSHTSGSESEAPSSQRDEACAAKVCFRPSGDQVNWVACDKCLEWYHMICEGLSAKEISEYDDYVCTRCTRGTAPDEAAPPPPPSQSSASSIFNSFKLS